MESLRNILRGLLCLGILPFASVRAQTNSYKLTPLVSDTQGLAGHVDANLLNPWGICIIPGNPFWLSDNNSGFTTLYSSNGTLQGSFTVAPPKGSSLPATPTGCVGNSTGGFSINGNSSLFIFDTEDGTISGWTGASSSVLAADNSAVPTAATGAVYKGLALVTNTTGSFLLATNFRSARVEVYDTNFQPTQVLGPAAFNDPAPLAVPAGSGSPGYAPFGVHVITVSGTPMVVVTYALQDTPMHDPLHIPGSGFVDLFSTDGTMVRRITSDSHLNAPWGAVIPPTSFGSFGASGNLLIGNFGDGVINAYNFASGAFVDSLKDQNGAVITNASLWDMVFDASGKTGDPNTMFITAGLANEMHGLFAGINVNSAPAATPDFTITATPAMMTIGAGQTASFSVTVGGINGFNSAVTLACSGAPINSTCNISPMSVIPASGGTSISTVTIATSSSPYMPATVTSDVHGTGITAPSLPALVLASIGLFLIIRRAGRQFGRFSRAYYLAGSFGFLIALAFLFSTTGCGYKAPASATSGTQRGTATVVITGTSSNLSHSASVTLTVQ